MSALLDAHLVGPRTAPLGIVVAHEGFGLTDFVRTQADRLARLGHRVVVPALYWRDGPLGYRYDEEREASARARALDVPDALADLGEAAASLQGAHTRPVVIVGWCLGAALGVAAAVQALPIAGAVAYYPVRVAEHSPTGTTACPLLVHLGDADEFVSVADLARLHALAEQPGVAVHGYAGARHGFANPDRAERFEPSAAQLADQRTEDLLAALVDNLTQETTCA